VDVPLPGRFCPARTLPRPSEHWTSPCDWFEL
jgi:hypothetical protein